MLPSIPLAPSPPLQCSLEAPNHWRPSSCRPLAACRPVRAPTPSSQMAPHPSALEKPPPSSAPRRPSGGLFLHAGRWRLILWLTPWPLPLVIWPPLPASPSTVGRPCSSPSLPSKPPDFSGLACPLAAPTPCLLHLEGTYGEPLHLASLFSAFPEWH
ncbi:hypothetical protein GOP47_0010954, partial [Adiantum capillus-veneris]